MTEHIISQSEPAWLGLTDPIAIFSAWLDDAKRSDMKEPTAMHLSTATPDGFPSSRIVLLRSFDADGFVFYTNTESRKGNEIKDNPNVALCFYWMPLCRQVRIEGIAQQVNDGEADAYYSQRPEGSRIGAWASLQSQPLPERGILVERVAHYAGLYQGKPIPRPPHWSGYRITPQRLEFWEEAPYRLHHRLVFEQLGGSWATHHLYP